MTTTKYLGSVGTGELAADIHEAPGGLFSAVQYFWILSVGPNKKAHGPFRSIPETTFHYEMFVGAKLAKVDINEPSNVIYVDFKNKKRIPL